MMAVSRHMVRTNVFNNTKYPGGMYSHATYIQARRLSFLFALNWYPALDIGIGTAFIWNQDRICRYSLGSIGASRTVKSRLRRHCFCEDGENPISIPSSRGLRSAAPKCWDCAE